MGVKVINGKQQLTEKQERFCIEYVLNKGNATEAAARAGYSDSTEGVLANIGYNLLRKVEIIAKISQLREESGINTGATLEWAVAVLVDIAEKRNDSFECRNSVAAIKALSDIMGWSEGKGSAVPIEKLADKLAEQWKRMKSA